MTVCPLHRFFLAALLWPLVLFAASPESRAMNPDVTFSLYKKQGTPLPAPPNSGAQPTILTPFARVDAGSSFVCGIRLKDRGISCWGLNEFGQLNPPTKGKFRQLSLGEMHGCAITLQNELLCWGNQSAVPINGDLKEKYITVSSGDSHTCAIKKSNRFVKCWGSNLQGQLNPPKARFKSISARNNQTCGVSTQGQVLCWGESAFINFNQPPGTFTDVTVGKLHACAVQKQDKAILCWGNNTFGTLNPPVGQRFKEVLSGDYHSCGVTLDQYLSCWGRDQYGQVSGLPAERIRSAGLGGALSCLTNEKHLIRCRGSYAYNGASQSLLPTKVKTDAESSIQKKGVGDFAAKGVGYGLKTWGESMEAGSPQQKFVFLVAELLGSKPDANKQRFETIQVELKEVQQQLTQINTLVENTYSAVQTLSCQVGLNEFNAYRQTARDAQTAYQIVVTQYLADLTDQQRGLGPNPKTRQLIESFVEEWDNPVNSKLRNLLSGAHHLLVDPSLSPLITCMNATLASWQRTAEHPFDDRILYKGAYQLHDVAQMMQVQALLLLQEISARQSLRALTDPSLDLQEKPLPVIDAKLIPETGLCAEARRQVGLFPSGTIPRAKARWSYAARYCDETNQLIKDTYKRLVQQIEFSGAPYTSDAVVASLSGRVFGQGTSTTNWLWINLDRVSQGEIDFTHSAYMGGFPMNLDPNNGFTSLVFKNGGEANWYSTNRGGGGLWQGASLAWEELYASYESYLKKVNRTDDLINLMARLEAPSINEAGEEVKVKLFPKIADEPIWMSNKTFDLEWNRLIGDSKTLQTTQGVRCFLAAGINPTWYYSSGGSKNPKVTLKLTGKVCSSEEFAAMARQISPESIYDDLWGNGNSATYSWTGGDKHYKKYEPLLGQWVFSGAIDAVIYPESNAKFLVDGVLRHYPVVDLGARACEPSMVKEPVKGDPATIRTRSLTRGADAVEIPTRCGKDMDRFIDDRVPRPENPPIPETEVRRPLL